MFVRVVALALLQAVVATSVYANDFDFAPAVNADAVALASNTAEQVETVAEGLTLDVTQVHLGANADPVAVTVDGVLFIPLDPSASTRLWQVQIDAPARTRVAFDFTQFVRDDAGLVQGFLSVDQVEVTGLSAPFEVAIPSVATHLEIATSGPTRVVMESVPLPEVAEQMGVGQMTTIALGKRIEHTLDYALPDGVARENIAVSMRLPVNIVGAATALVDHSSVTYPLAGRPATSPAFAFDVPVQTLRFDMSRAAGFADDPWPAVPVMLRLQDVASDEVEPNQSPEQATAIGGRADARRIKVHGRLSDHVDIDYWQFSYTKNMSDRALEVELNVGTAHAKVALLAPDDTVLTTAHGSGRIEIGPLVLPVGEYKIAISEGERATTDYALQLKSIRPPRVGDEMEPNDTPSYAQDLPLNSPVDGRVSTLDVDFYAVEITTPGRMWGVLSPGELDVRLTDSDGDTIIQSVYDSTSGMTRTSPTPLPMGHYLVRVTGDDDYAIEMRDFGPRPKDWELEPNGAQHQANYLTLGEQLRGQLSSGNHDTIYFDVPVDQNVTLTVEAPDDAAMQVDLAYHSGRPYEYTRLPRGGRLDQVFAFEAGEYALTLSLYPDAPTFDSWRVAVAPYVGEPPVDLEPNRDQPRRLKPFQRIVGDEGGIDFDDVFEVPLPAQAGRVLYPCRYRAGGEFSVGIGPSGLRTADVRFRKITPAGTVYDGAPDQSFYANNNAWQASGYDCAVHWLTSQVLGGMAARDGMRTFDWATGFEAGGLRAPSLPVAYTFGPETGKTQHIRLNLDAGAASFFMTCNYEDGLLSAAIFDDAGKRLQSHRINSQKVMEFMAPSQVMYVGLEKQTPVELPYTCAFAQTAAGLEADPVAFASEAAPNRDQVNLVDLGFYSQDLLPGELRIVPQFQFKPEPDAGSGTIVAQCEGADARGVQTPLEPAFFAKEKQWGYRPDLPDTAVSYQCAFVDADDLPMLPLPLQGNNHADRSLDVEIVSDIAFAPFIDHGQRGKVQMTLRNTGSTSVTLDVQAAIAARAWSVTPKVSTVALTAGEVKTLALTVTAPPMLLLQDTPALHIAASSGGNLAINQTQNLTIARDAPPLEPFAYWRVPAALAGGINVAETRFGGAVSHIGDIKTAEASIMAIDGIAATQGDNIPWFADRQSSFTIDLSGDQPQPVKGFFYTLRSQSVYHDRPMRRMMIERSMDGATYLPLETFDLLLTADRQYFVLPDTVSATHIRVTNPDCRQRYCLSTTEFGVISEPGHWPSRLPLMPNIADLGNGGNLITTTAEIGPRSDGLLFTPDDLRFVVVAPDGGVPPLAQFVIGFHNARKAQVMRIEWSNDTGEHAPVTFKVSALADVLSPAVPLGQITSPVAGETTELILPAGIDLRFLQLEANLPEGTYVLGGQLKVLEAPTVAGGYRSILGVWDEDDPRGASDWDALASVIALPDKTQSTRDTPLVLPAGAPVQSRTHKEGAPDHYQLPAGKEGQEWRIISLSAPRYVEVGPTLTDAQGNAVPLRWLDDVLLERPELEDALSGVLPNAPQGWADQVHYLAQIDPTQMYQLEIAEQGRLMIIRRERTGMLRRSDTVRKRSYSALAEILGDGRDALDVGIAGLDGSTLLQGEDQILLGMSRLPGLDDDEAVATTDFGDAVAASAKQIRRWPGGKALVYFGMGGGLMQVEDMDWVLALKGTPVRTAAVLAPCDAGNFFCPDPMLTDVNAMTFAASTGGRFTRTATRNDLRRALLQAAYAMQGPKPYNVTWRDVTPAPAPARLSVTGVETDVSKTQNAQTGIEAPPPALGLILDASGSMLKRIGDERRIKVAKDALGDLITTGVPDGTLVSFRAFGLAQDSCETRNLWPLAPLDRQALLPIINDVPAINLAKTPIAASLRAAVLDDLANAEGAKALILLTDGEETCDGNVEGVIAELREAGITISLSIVGFAIDDPALKAEFARWADIGNGQYYDAGDAPALRSALIAALTRAVPPPQPTTVDIRADGDQDMQQQIAVGEMAVLPAGDYVLTLDTGAIATVTLDAGQEVVINAATFQFPTPP